MEVVSDGVRIPDMPMKHEAIPDNLTYGAPAGGLRFVHSQYSIDPDDRGQRRNDDEYDET